MGLAAGLSIGAPSLAQVQTTVSRAQVEPPTALNAPRTFADIVERVAPAVVSVRTRRQVAIQAPAIPGFPFERFFGSPAPGPSEQAPTAPAPQRREARGEGSGFFISADGYIVTNNHVVDNADAIEVVLSDKRVLKAAVVGRDGPTDLAVLKVEGRDFAFVSFADQGAPRVGDWVVAVGNPFGLGGTATAGIVSAYGREIGSTFVDYMQIDAAINRGNSGGPTFDAQGRVIGVNTMIYSPTGGSVGIGFAIPAGIADQIVRRLIADGRIDRGYIGATIQSLTVEIAETQGLTSSAGALVTEVVAGGPAAQAGLVPGDIVTHLNERSIANSSQLVRQIAATTPGRTLALGVVRNGVTQTLVVRADLRPGEDAAAPAADGLRQPFSATPLGLTVRPLDDAARRRAGAPLNLEGVVIEAVRPASDAANKGLRSGDIIVRANGRTIAGLRDLAAAVDEARRADRQSVLLFVYREGRQQALVVRLAERSSPE